MTYFTPFLKTGESLFGPATSVKGRLIWDPPAWIKVPLGVVNYNLL